MESILRQIEHRSYEYEVRGTICGGERSRWYPISAVEWDDGTPYGVSVPMDGMDGAGLILICDIKAIRHATGEKSQ